MRLLRSNALKKLFEKYKDLIPYAIFGVLTTIVNIVVYWLCSHVLHVSVMTSTIIAWFVAVLFAYLTNRKWVFHSEAHTAPTIAKEILYFFACRIGTELADILCMYVFVERLHWNDVIVKAIANIIVILLNYIASKFVIFRHELK